MIFATFEGLGLSTIGKLPENQHVETLNFSSNAIQTYWPDPFSQIRKLKRLSFAHNDLTEITPDLFTNIDQLEDLDLSYNKLYDFNPLDFKYLARVKKFNLQSNQLKKIPLEALQSMISLEDLDLSKNNIYDLLLQKKDNLPMLKILNLSGNRIRSITRDSFPDSNNIELVDLSNNVIEIVEDDAFLKCTNLRELNLAQNNITFSFDFPPSLQVITLRINRMHSWPRFPSGIKLIDMSYNRLQGIYDESVTELHNLEYLDISGNQLKDFTINKQLNSLLSLKLSFNLLQEIPQSINNEMFPLLHVLTLDGNPIETIYFKKPITLEILSLTELNNVRVIEKRAFSNVAPRIVENYEDNCFSLFLSNCPSLEVISDGAFDDTSLCMLDISGNNLTSISRDLLDWSKLNEGINLQFNPWDCSCDMQWILDELLPKMIRSNSRLLAEFRCHSPRGYEGLRLVHFYNWTEKAMCDGPSDNFLLDVGSGQKVSSLTLVLVGIIVVGLLVIVVLIVYLIRNRKRYRLRQAALKRKRQSLRDSKNSCELHKEQFSALNRM
ncbi:toll-like receptor 3 [Hyposmocoma kahamanoa]|uniref:toll-like receptor 3 n=1 Tax=Hyposmocoma kahamanoa TaxID=1477025 RepID=UPI000E6D6BDC|nr:toll-like receptor 3 [Hyposmocoma kahamanoa]